MKSPFTSIAEAIERVVDYKLDRAGTSEQTVPATYLGTDDQGKAFVRLAGSDESTPVKSMTVQADVGDTVRATVGNGRVVVSANASNPSASTSNVGRVEEQAVVAKETAVQAIDHASEAMAASSAAKASASSAMSAAVTAQQSADSAQADATRAYSAAEDAVSDAARAQDAADAAQEDATAANNSLKSVVSGATTVEKAVSVMQTALEAVVDYDPQEDTVTEYFWHDANGAHVLGDTSGYRNDIDSSGMDIVDVNTERSVAQFGANGARIGKAYDSQELDNESHMVLDYHSMQMVDKEGNSYFLVSDLRDRTGKATITDTFVGDGSTTRFTLSLTGDGSEVTVTVDGQPVSFRGSNTSVELDEAPASGSIVLVTYKTSDENAKAYTLGTRNATSPVGARSTVVGQQCAASGLYSYAEGEFSTSRGEASHAEGIDTIASQPAAHAEGHATSATMRYAHAEGSGSIASGDSSHAEGSSTAAGASSHAEGQGTHAYGNRSHAEGKDTTTTAQAEAAHAEGDGTTAWGTSSHAEGHNSVARGSSSHAEGGTCEASGTASHAEGAQCVAGGDWSHAQNYHTLASSDKQTAIGKCNVADSADTYALIIGNGADDSNRSNALTVDWNGNVVAAGGLDLGTSLAITDGGTGATTAQGARANLDVPGLSTSNTFLNSNQTIKQTNVDTTEDDNGITGAVNRYWSILDKNNHYAMWVGMEANTSGRIRTSIGARNYGGDSQADNAVYLDVENDGTRSVGFSSGGKAAWQTALGLNTWATVTQANFLTVTSGWAVTAFNCQYNAALGVVRLRVTIDPDAAQTAGQKTLFTVKTAYRPKTFAASVPSLTSNAQAGQLYTSGGFAVNIAAISAGTNLYFIGEYHIGA